MAKSLRSFSPLTSPGCKHNAGHSSVSRQQDGVDYRNEDSVLLMNSDAKNASSTSALCGAAVTKITYPIQWQATFFFFYCFSANVVIEYLLVTLDVPCKCHSRWASAFLTLPIHAKAMPWTVHLVAWFYLILLYVDFFSASEIHVRSLFSQARVLVNVFFLLSTRIEYSCAWKILSFNTCKLFWTPLWFPSNPTY